MTVKIYFFFHKITRHFYLLALFYFISRQHSFKFINKVLHLVTFFWLNGERFFNISNEFSTSFVLGLGATNYSSPSSISSISSFSVCVASYKISSPVSVHDAVITASSTLISINNIHHHHHVFWHQAWFFFL